jgi:GT2 family glycosyltransferase
VVDNNSGQDAVTEIETRFPQITLIANQENRGFAAASNQALRRAQGKYMMLLNPDAYLERGNIQPLLEYMDVHPHVGIVGPRILNQDGTLQLSAFPHPSVLRDLLSGFRLDRLFHFGKVSRRYLRPAQSRSHPFQVGWVSGACLLIRKETLEDIGLLDDNFFLFSEDVDLCLRATRGGWEVVFHPGLTVVHLGGQSTKKNLALKIESFYRKRLYFARKHFGALPLLLLKMTSLGELVVKTIIVKLSRTMDPWEREERLRGYRSALKVIFSRI